MIGRLVAAALLLVGLSALAQAQNYPNRVVKFIHGFPPGGNVDLIARILAGEMEKGLGQQIVVENRVGAGGAIAAESIARGEPDGYTLLVVPSSHAAYGALAKNVKFNVVDDFAWISALSSYPFMVSVKADSRFRSLSQLVDEARSRPGQLKYGSGGIGSIFHTTVELMGHRTGTKYMHVPYRGEVPAITGMLTGDIDFIAATPTTVGPRVKAGEFRALAVTGPVRWRDFPDVPTVAESVIPNFEVISWTGMAGPPNLPKPIVERLNAELRKALAVPEVKARLEAMGGDPRATSPDDMKALVLKQYETWKRLAVEANLSID